MDEEFLEKYINPNLRPGDRPYDDALFSRILEKMKVTNEALFSHVGPSVLVSADDVLAPMILLPGYSLTR